MAHFDTDILSPELVFVTIAICVGMWVEGQINRPEEDVPAIRRALKEVKFDKPAKAPATGAF